MILHNDLIGEDGDCYKNIITNCHSEHSEESCKSGKQGVLRFFATLRMTSWLSAHLHICTSAHYEYFSSIIFSKANISSRSLAARRKSISLAAASISFLVLSMDFFRSALVIY